jgi:hypothetical protein
MHTNASSSFGHHRPTKIGQSHVIFLQIFFGSLKTDMAYIEIAWATSFSKISLPPIQRYFSFHPFMRSNTLFTK